MPMQPANSGISAQPTSTPSVTMENRSSSPVEIQYLKEDNQSGKNITNNMVAENIVPYLTQPAKTALNSAEASVQTNETSEQKKQEPITSEAKIKYEQMDMFEDKFLTPEAKKKHRIIGQLFKTYWLIEYEDKFFIMDQHAAHEKVKFEELMANYKNKTAIPQYLMPPGAEQNQSSYGKIWNFSRIWDFRSKVSVEKNTSCQPFRQICSD